MIVPDCGGMEGSGLQAAPFPTSVLGLDHGFLNLVPQVWVVHYDLDLVKIIVHNPYLWDEIKKTMIQPQNGGREGSGLEAAPFHTSAIGYNHGNRNNGLQPLLARTDKEKQEPT